MEKVINDIIEVNTVSKKFKNHYVLHNVTLKINRGKYYYIKGGNGSGKSTLMKLMMGLLLPDNGDVNLFGSTTESISNETKKKIGFILASERSLYYKLTAYENLYFIGRMYGVDKNELKLRIPILLEEVGLDNSKKYVETYSTGMKKKLMIARAFVHNPEIVFADEVYNGLDQEACKKIATLFREQHRKGTTLVVISHLDDYIEQTAIEVIINNGEVRNSL